MRETCLHCAHADFRDAAAKGMTGFLTCPMVDKWRYLNRRTVCESGKFQTASIPCRCICSAVAPDCRDLPRKERKAV